MMKQRIFATVIKFYFNLTFLINYSASTVLDSPVRENAISLEDVFISVTTTRSLHHVRIPAILMTWYLMAQKQTWFFTDTEDAKLDNYTNGHVVNTNCLPTHHPKGLCCKTVVEFDFFILSNKRWFCHFDDDVYVNVPRLVEELQRHARADVYLGRRSTKKPRTSVQIPVDVADRAPVRSSFWFAHGGAGFCISRSLALKMLPLVCDGKFEKICASTLFADDITVGFIIEAFLNIDLTVVDQFHSHMERMASIRPETLQEQITVSYDVTDSVWNVVNVTGFDPRLDPTRFLSLHCHLFPIYRICNKIKKL